MDKEATMMDEKVTTLTSGTCLDSGNWRLLQMVLSIYRRADTEQLAGRTVIDCTSDGRRSDKCTTTIGRTTTDGNCERIAERRRIARFVWNRAKGWWMN